MKRVLPTTQFAYRKGLGACDALLCVSHTLQSALESRQEARIVQIDFSAAFDKVRDNARKTEKRGEPWYICN